MGRYGLILAVVGWMTVVEAGAGGTQGFEQQVTELSRIVQACVERRDTDHPLFHGCIDWHSSVHGHWALIYAAKKLQSTPEPVFTRLQPELVAEELSRLRAGDTQGEFFERPYGRAWFLQLARDSEQFFADRRQHEAAEYIYSTLLEYAQTQGGEILSAEYDNASWYLYQLDRWAQHTGRDGDRRLIRQLAVNRLEAVQIWPDFHAIRGFFAPKALAVLLADAVGDQQQVHRLEAVIKAESLVPLPMPWATAHQGGLNYSRAWGLWTLFRATGNPTYLHAYRDHLQAMEKNRPLWQGDYQRYGHWVAQFGLFAHRLADFP